MNIFISVGVVLAAVLLAYTSLVFIPMFLRNKEIDEQKIDLDLVKSELILENEELIKRLREKLTREIESTMDQVELDEYNETVDQLFHFLGEIDRTFDHIVGVEDNYVSVEGLTRLKEDLKHMIRHESSFKEVE